MGTENNGVEDFPPLKSNLSSSGINGLTSVEKVIEDKQGDVPQLVKDGFVIESVNCKIASGLDNSRAQVSVGGSDSSKSKEWRTLFPYPQPITSQPSFKFTPPVDLNGQKVVDSSVVDFSKGIKRCEEYVVGFCVGRTLSFAAVKEAVSKLWKLKNEVSIKLHGNGAFIFEFKDDEDRNRVLELGSFYISNCLFTLRPWSNMIESSVSSIRTIPIWVLIYGIPLHMWDSDGLGLISSFIGKPLLADECTLKRTRLAYARICVEVDIECDYPESIPLMIDGKIALELPVEYPWKPPRCDLCKVFGHLSKNCSKSRKSKWVAKKQGKIQVHSSLHVANKDKKSVEGNKVLATKTAVDGEDKARDAEQTSTEIEVEMGFIEVAGSSRVAAATTVSTTTQGIKGAMHKSVEATVLDINADKRCNMVKKTSISDRGKHEFSAKSPIKSASSGPKTAGMGSGSTPKSAGVQATENGHQHKPFHLSSDFPYQWKDLAKDVKKDNHVKETNATSDDGHWNTASNRKSPVKNAVMEKKGTTKITSSDSCVKVNNSFRVLSNENQQSFQDQHRVLVEECGEDNEDLYDVESDKYAQNLAHDDKHNKKIEKERSRLKWNGEIPNENLGKGQRSAIRKQK